MGKTTSSWLVVGATLFFVYLGGSVSAAEFKVVSATGVRAVISDLAAHFERTSGHRLIMHYDGNADWRRKISAGETFDVAVFNPTLIDELIKEGKIAGDTRADVARSGIGMAVRKGAPKPDISSVEAFKRALLSAKTVSYSKEGASGIYFINLLDRLGISKEIATRSGMRRGFVLFLHQTGNQRRRDTPLDPSGTL